MSIRLPAEWEAQDGVLLSWPHRETDWFPILKSVVPVFTQIASLISHHEKAVIVAPEPDEVLKALKKSGAVLQNISIHKMPVNDTWARDFGPVTALKNGKPLILDFTFNAWGMKFAANFDNRVTGTLFENKAFSDRTKLHNPGMVLEGGSIESDGDGTILTTSQCLLSPNRNSHLGKKEIERKLRVLLGAKKVLWLGSGHLEGDDTDAHIDTLARLCPGGVIAYVSCDNKKDPHYAPLADMKKELENFTDRKGKPYVLVPLPLPAARYNKSGKRLPATYANFLVINGAVLLPVYGDKKNDAAAIASMEKIFPDRKIFPVDCVPLIHQFGSLHCVTMQLPKGVLK